ncbi:MAG: hypothetical protein ACLR06_10485 [Christensenellaceae bacterium]
MNSYELTITNDSAFSEIVDISGRKEYNAEITVTVEATHLGYTFLGWYEGRNCSARNFLTRFPCRQKT